MFSSTTRAVSRAARAAPLLARSAPVAVARRAIAVPVPAAAASRLYSTAEAVAEGVEYPQVASLNTFTDEEIAMREMVSKFAQEVIAPRVKAMDEAEVMDKEVIKGLFENGLMGIEVEPEFGGSGASFVSSLIAVEETAKVDPTVSIIIVSASRCAATADEKTQKDVLVACGMCLGHDSTH